MNEFSRNSALQQMAWRDRLARRQSYSQSEPVTCCSHTTTDTVFGGAVASDAFFQLTDRKEVISHE